MCIMFIINSGLIIIIQQNNDVRSLKQFHYTEWPEEKCPNSSTSLLDMIALVQKAHHLYGGGPVVVHDRLVNILEYTVVYWNILKYTRMYCNILLWYAENILMYSVVLYNTVMIMLKYMYTVVYWNILKYTRMYCNILMYNYY